MNEAERRARAISQDATRRARAISQDATRRARAISQDATRRAQSVYGLHDDLKNNIVEGDVLKYCDYHGGFFPASHGCF